MCAGVKPYKMQTLIAYMWIMKSLNQTKCLKKYVLLSYLSRYLSITIWCDCDSRQVQGWNSHIPQTCVPDTAPSPSSIAYPFFSTPDPSSTMRCVMHLTCVCVCVHPSPCIQVPCTFHIWLPLATLGPGNQCTVTYSGRWISEETYADPRGRLSALWKRNYGVPDTQSMFKMRRGTGFRWAHPLDSIKHLWERHIQRRARMEFSRAWGPWQGPLWPWSHRGTRCREMGRLTH